MLETKTGGFGDAINPTATRFVRYESDAATGRIHL